MRNPDIQTAEPEARATAPVPVVSVAICTRNRSKFLKRAAESVLRQMIRADDELLIVDNASTDDTPQVAAGLAAADPHVKVWREEELGLSAARNAALQRARGRFVLFLDDDATAQPGWLEAYQQFLSRPPSQKIAVVGGAVFPDFEIAPPKWVNPDVGFNLGDSAKCLPYRDSPWGGNSAYRRDAALAAGLFDTRLGRKGEKMLSREESDLNLRLQDAGHEIWWLPGAGILHFIPASRLSFRTAMRSWFAEGRSIAIQRTKARTAGLDRGLYRLARVAVAPFHAAAHLLAALFLLPVNPFKAAGHFFQVCRNCGFASQLLLEAIHGTESQK